MDMDMVALERDITVKVMATHTRDLADTRKNTVSATAKGTRKGKLCLNCYAVRHRI